MKKQIKISLLSLVCGLCTATFSPAFGAPAVRSLGGAGTYTGVSSASAAKTSGASAAKSVRASAVRNTAANLGSVKSTVTSASSTRSAATPRLSIGKYLGGAVSVGGSTISKGEAGGELAGNVDDLQLVVEQLQQKIENIHNDFKAAASGDNSNFIKTTGSAGGDKFSFELNVPSLVEHVKKDLSGQMGGNVEMRYNEETGYVQYKDAQGAWVDLVAVSTQGALDDMAAELENLEKQINEKVIPDVSGFATKEELQAVSEAIPDVSGLDLRVGAVEEAVSLDGLKTEAKTIVGALNEIKAKADGALTSENLGQLNQDVSGLKDMVLGTETTDGLLGTVDALSQDVTDVSTALDGKIPVPSVACSGGSGICVLTVKGNNYEWVELELPVEPK